MSNRKSAPPTPRRRAPATQRLRASAADGSDAETPDLQKDSLGYALRRAQMRSYDLYFTMLGDLDLTPARTTALSLIAMEADISQAELAKRLDIAGPSVLKLVDALEGAGLIQRMDVEGDRRRYSLALTELGRARLAALRVALSAYEARLAARLKASERTQLLALLERIG